MNKIDVMNHLSTAGDVAAGLTCSANTLRFADLPTRTRAASAAGFTGIGLRVSDYTQADIGDSALRDLLDEGGLQILELEHTWDWTAQSADPVEQTMYHLADRIGCRQLNVCMYEDHDLERLVGPFGRLCDRASAHGLLVGLEFLPYSRIRTLREAWQIVSDADRPNSGVIIDLWHWFRSAATLTDLAEVPAERITSIQLCDVLADPRPAMAEEARHHRQLPGHGAGDTATLLGWLSAHAIDVPASVEVFSDALDALPPTQAARAAAIAATSVLTATGWSPTPTWTTTGPKAGHR